MCVSPSRSFKEIHTQAWHTSACKNSLKHCDGLSAHCSLSMVATRHCMHLPLPLSGRCPLHHRTGEFGVMWVRVTAPPGQKQQQRQGRTIGNTCCIFFGMRLIPCVTRFSISAWASGSSCGQLASAVRGGLLLPVLVTTSVFIHMLCMLCYCCITAA